MVTIVAMHIRMASEVEIDKKILIELVLLFFTVEGLRRD